MIQSHSFWAPSQKACEILLVIETSTILTLYVYVWHNIRWPFRRIGSHLRVQLVDTGWLVGSPNGLLGRPMLENCGPA